uniref:G-protein coupled receptors family 1 profile domain-containing protein n=1 Tax=Acrobeloides nanus TaxID=290746 RepID=A0A914BZK5_9BILA
MKVFLVVSFQLIIIGVLSVPVVYYADVMEVEILSENGKNLTHLETIRMCRSDMPDEILPYFVFLMILLGCIAPTTITWCSYICLVICLGKKSGTSPLVQAYRSRVAVFLFLAVIIHFICWAPNWYALLSVVVSDYLIMPSPNLMHIIM